LSKEEQEDFYKTLEELNVVAETEKQKIQIFWKSEKARSIKKFHAHILIFELNMQKTPTIIIPSIQPRKEKVKGLIDLIYQKAGTEFNLHLLINKGTAGTIACMLEMINILPDDMLILQFNDDFYPITDDFLKKLVEKYKETFGEKEGVLQCNDTHHNGRLATMPFAPAGYYKKYFYKGYKNYFVDNEFKKIAELQNKYVYCPEVIIQHRHYAFNMDIQDEMATRNMQKFNIDLDLYNERAKLSNGFKDLSKIKMSYDD
jgi:hypothetical protein